MHIYQTKNQTWATLAARRKCDKVNPASLCNKRNTTNSNSQKLNKAQ